MCVVCDVCYNRDVKGWHKVYRASAIGVPHFLAPLQKENGDIFKPSMYLGQFVVSSVLALDVILTDTKKKVWFSGHVPRRKLKARYSGHIPRCQVVVLDQMRSATIGLLLHVQLTECTSNIDLAIRNPFRKVTFQ